MGKPTDRERAGDEPVRLGGWGKNLVDHSHYAFGATTDVLTLQHEIV